MKHQNHACAGIFAVLLSLTLLQSSCGFIVWNDPDAESTTADETTTAESTESTAVTETTAPPETAAERDYHAEAITRLDELPYRSFSDSNILIVTCDSTTVAPIIDSVETAGETLTARALAAKAVADRYSTKLIAVNATPYELLDAAREADAADMYYADLLVVPQTSVGTLYAAGLLANLHSLPFADYSQPYYDAKTVREAQLGNELRAVSGAATLNPDYLTGIFFNRDLAEKCGLTDPYKLVRDGKWTYEVMLEYTAAANSIDGMEGFGAGLSQTEIIDLSVGAMDLEFVTTMRGQLPTLDYMKDGAMSSLASGIVDTLYRLLYRNSALPDTPAVYFATGNRLFHAETLDAIPKLTDAKVRWGLLPMPKYSESQTTYLSPLTDDAPVFCALAGTPDYEKPGLILESLNAVCHEYIYKTYMNEAINHHLRDSGSIEMLERIIEGRTTDFSKLFSSGIASLEDATYGAIRGAVTTSSSLDSIYNSSASAAEKALAGSTVIR